MKLASGPVIRTAVAAVIAAAALAGSAAATGGAPVPGQPASASGLRVAAAIELGGAPSSMVMAAGTLWVSLGVEGIARIDPATNKVVARIRPGGIALAAGFGSIWAIDVFFDELLRIDPDTNRITDRIPVGGLPTGIAIGHGSVWVANQLDATVSRVSPTTGRTIATIHLDRGAIWPGAILSTAAGIWVVAQDGMVVNRIRPQTESVDLRIAIPYARTLAAALGSVWVGIADSTSLVRITHGKTARVALPGRRADGYGPRLAGGRHPLARSSRRRRPGQTPGQATAQPPAPGRPPSQRHHRRRRRLGCRPDGRTHPAT